MDSFPNNSLPLQGLGMSFGSVEWNHPRFPTLHERAALLATRLPRWAIASGTTAGWVWTGMGMPEPWEVLRPPRPALSPLQRTLWSAREQNPRHHTIQRMSGLTLLSAEATAREVLFSSTPVDSRAAQLWVLESLCPRPLATLLRERRSTARARGNARAALIALAGLQENYPDITR